MAVTPGSHANATSNSPTPAGSELGQSQAWMRDHLALSGLKRRQTLRGVRTEHGARVHEIGDAERQQYR
jgi:hypothetical protein